MYTSHPAEGFLHYENDISHKAWKNRILFGHKIIVPFQIEIQKLVLAAALIAALFMAGQLRVQAQTGVYSVTVAPRNQAFGAVNASINGTSFDYCCYAGANDYISVTAVVANKNYVFQYWVDNGSIVSKNTVYSFGVGNRNHKVEAVFDQDSQIDAKRYNSKHDISSVTKNKRMIGLASGYNYPGLTINGQLIPIDDATENACQQLTAGIFDCAYSINYTSNNGTSNLNTLPQPMKLTVQLSQLFLHPGNYYHVVYLPSMPHQFPVILEDSDDDSNTVTFETSMGGNFVITHSTARISTLVTVLTPQVFQTPAVAASPVPSAVPVQSVPTPSGAPAASSVQAPTASQAQTPAAQPSQLDLLLAQVQLLRAQLQQAGITPLT